MYKKEKTRVNDEKKSIVFWLLLLFVTLFLIIAPFHKGLFNGGQHVFERPIYTTVIWSSLALFLLFLSNISDWKKNSFDMKANLVWIIPLCYMISLIQAASHFSAVNVLFIHITFAMFFLVSAKITINKIGYLLLPNILQYSTYIVVIYGFMNWFGNAHYQDAVFQNRLTSVFQYPNSYGAFLIGALISSLFLIVNARKWYDAVIHYLMLVPIFTSLFLTLSRGSLMILPFVVIIILLMMPLFNQVLILVGLILSGIASLLILNKLMNIGTQLHQTFNVELSMSGWAILIVTSIVVSLIFIGINILGKKINITKINNLGGRFSKYIIPSLILLFILMSIYLLFGNSKLVSFLPESIRERIEATSLQDNSILARTTYYKDSINLFFDYPIIGAGGGGWSSLYQQYQSYPYTSRQAHNFLLQYLTEIGLLGILAIVFFILFIFIRYIKKYNLKINGQESDKTEVGSVHVFFLFSVSILVHALLDFDLSFLYLAAVVFLCFGGMYAYSARSGDNNKAINTTNKDIRWPFYISTSLLLIVSISSFIYGIKSLNGNTYFSKALNEINQQRTDFNLISKYVDNAIESNPNHPEYALLKINLLKEAFIQTKDEKFHASGMNLIDSMIDQEPFNKQLIEQKFNYYLLMDKKDEALQYLISEQHKFKWDISMYENIVALNFDLGNEFRNRDKLSENIFWQNNKKIFEDILAVKQNLDETLVDYQKFESRNFRITPKIALVLGQIYYIEGDYDKASQAIYTALSNDFNVEFNRIMARWYLASLLKQNKQDEKLMSDLLEKDPNEQVQIDTLLKSQF